MFGLSPFELMAVLVVAVLLFGAKLPEVAGSLGRQYRDFRRGLNEIQDQFRQAQQEVTKAFDAPAKTLNKSLADLDPNTPKEREPAVPKFTPPPPSHDEES
ncbi:MAG: twin-arginine translocase TatA/TatE family subunit [Planctomycetaceae bacterium]|nr:MAG: twin-arginine translocase TatA/TatE family subunit [Planctomycetaceae bacterium]